MASRDLFLGLNLTSILTLTLTLTLTWRPCSRATVQSESGEGIGRMLGSVSACVRAVEKNVSELDDFLTSWIGDEVT